MSDENIEINEEKIAEAFKNNIKLHIILKDKSWRNGFVKTITPSYFIFEDTFNGEEPIFYLEVFKAEPFMKG